MPPTGRSRPRENRQCLAKFLKFHLTWVRRGRNDGPSRHLSRLIAEIEVDGIEPGDSVQSSHIRNLNHPPFSKDQPLSAEVLQDPVHMHWGYPADIGKLLLDQRQGKNARVCQADRLQAQVQLAQEVRELLERRCTAHQREPFAVDRRVDQCAQPQ